MKKLIVLILVIFLVACSSKKEEELEINEPVVNEPQEDPKPDPKPEPEPEPEPEPVYSRFTGLETTDDNRNLRPVMVMVDNHHDARNQANLSKASIVYEMRVEGLYTRYAALFEKQNEEVLVGPIRSARPNFVELAVANNAIYTHYGGSDDGLRAIYAKGITDIDGGVLEGVVTFRYFDTGKLAPHNAYTYIDDIYNYVESQGISLEDSNENFQFNQEFTPLNNDSSAPEIAYDYDANWNAIRFVYDQENQNYLRYREGILQVDELTETPVTPTNIILQIADSYVYTQYGHKAFYTVGSGTGYYFTGGEVMEINWTKESEDAPTIYTDQNGAVLKLNPGQTWISVIDSWMGVTY